MMNRDGNPSLSPKGVVVAPPPKFGGFAERPVSLGFAAGGDVGVFQPSVLFQHGRWPNRRSSTSGMPGMGVV